jgi:hypothetical protein
VKGEEEKKMRVCMYVCIENDSQFSLLLEEEITLNTIYIKQQ